MKLSDDFSYEELLQRLSIDLPSVLPGVVQSSIGGSSGSVNQPAQGTGLVWDASQQLYVPSTTPLAGVGPKTAWSPSGNLPWSPTGGGGGTAPASAYYRQLGNAIICGAHWVNITSFPDVVRIAPPVGTKEYIGSHGNWSAAYTPNNQFMTSGVWWPDDGEGNILLTGQDETYRGWVGASYGLNPLTVLACSNVDVYISGIFLVQ